MAPPGSSTILGVLGRHPVHPFPARMAPEIVSDILAGADRSLRVLDPMMGSGTVLALAQNMKHRAVGVDVDPLAALIAGVWTSPVNPKSVRQRAKEILARATNAPTLAGAKTYPVSANPETKKFIRYWFDASARRELLALSQFIARTRDLVIRNVLWCAFSRLIIAKKGASRALDLVHSRPHRFFDACPISPFGAFLQSVEFVLANVPEKHGRGNGPKAAISLGDARRLRVKSSSIDLILTSPPYLNAIDYMRCSKFSLVWMGYKIDELRDVRARSVGAEVGMSGVPDNQLAAIVAKLGLDGLPKRQHAMVTAYIADMRNSLREAQRVLVPGGRAVYVIGENTMRGVYVRNASMLSMIAEAVGLEVEYSTRRELPPSRRYLPPPKKGAQSLDGRMRHEIVLHLRKGDQVR